METAPIYDAHEKVLRIDLEWVCLRTDAPGVFLEVGENWKVLYYVSHGGPDSFIEVWLIVGKDVIVPRKEQEAWLRAERYSVRQNDMVPSPLGQYGPMWV